MLTGRQVADVLGWSYDPDWRDGFLACADRSTDLFYAYASLPRGPKQDRALEHAQGICRTCPAKDSCGADAIGRREEFGVFGGMSPSQRSRVRLSVRKLLGVDGLFDELRSVG